MSNENQKWLADILQSGGSLFTKDGNVTFYHLDCPQASIGKFSEMPGYSDYADMRDTVHQFYEKLHVHFSQKFSKFPQSSKNGQGDQESFSLFGIFSPFYMSNKEVGFSHVMFIMVYLSNILLRERHPGYETFFNLFSRDEAISPQDFDRKFEMHSNILLAMVGSMSICAIFDCTENRHKDISPRDFNKILEKDFLNCLSRVLFLIKTSPAIYCLFDAVHQDTLKFFQEYLEKDAAKQKEIKSPILVPLPFRIESFCINYWERAHIIEHRFKLHNLMKRKFQPEKSEERGLLELCARAPDTIKFDPKDYDISAPFRFVSFFLESIHVVTDDLLNGFSGNACKWLLLDFVLACKEKISFDMKALQAQDQIDFVKVMIADAGEFLIVLQDAAGIAGQHDIETPKFFGMHLIEECLKTAEDILNETSLGRDFLGDINLREQVFAVADDFWHQRQVERQFHGIVDFLQPIEGAYRGVVNSLIDGPDQQADAFKKFLGALDRFFKPKFDPGPEVKSFTP